jgi:hypothetical protein
VVDRELLMICPDGEDHRGHEKGDTAGEGSGRERWHEWRRLRRMRTSMDGSWYGTAVRRTCDNWTEDEDRAGGRITVI